MSAQCCPLWVQLRQPQLGQLLGAQELHCHCALLCGFDCDKEKLKITHIGRKVTMETRRQFSVVWPVLTEPL